MSCFRSIDAGRVLGRVHEDVPGRGDREVALSPAVDLVELGGVADGKTPPSLPVADDRASWKCSRDHDTARFLRLRAGVGGISALLRALSDEFTLTGDERASSLDEGTPRDFALPRIGAAPPGPLILLAICPNNLTAETSLAYV